MPQNPGGDPAAPTLDVQFYADTGNVVIPAPPAHAPNIGTGNGVVQSVVAGTNITVDDTDPANPVVSASGGGGGGPGGVDGDIQFNDSGAFGGNGGVTTDKAGGLTLTAALALYDTAGVGAFRFSNFQGGVSTAQFYGFYSPGNQVGFFLCSGAPSSGDLAPCQYATAVNGYFAAPLYTIYQTTDGGRTWPAII